MYRSIILLILVGMISMACSSRTTIRPGDSVDVAFEKAMVQYENERYSQAARSFETVLSIARGTDIAREAQFYLAESYFKSRDYLLAASEYQRYATNYPRSPNRKEAEFKEALCYYELSPRYKLDQADTHRAIERFQLFINRYPGTDEAREAANYVSELREKLAKKKYHAAELYLRLNRYNAAAVYHELTIDRYPDTSWAEKSLVRQIYAYVLYAENSVEERQQERFEKAVNSYEQYLQLFPRGENRHLAEQYYNRALDGLADVVQITSSE